MPDGPDEQREYPKDVKGFEDWVADIKYLQLLSDQKAGYELARCIGAYIVGMAEMSIKKPQKCAKVLIQLVTNESAPY